MSQVNNHLKWCLKDEKRLIKTRPNLELAQKHLKKSDFDKIKQKILKCEGADRLRKLNQEDDLEFSLKLDIYDIIPKYNFESCTLIN